MEKVKLASNLQPRESMIRTKIPVPATKIPSKIPVNLSSVKPEVKAKIPEPAKTKSKIQVPPSKCQPRASLIARVPNMKNTIIQPIVTKKPIPQFKDFQFVKGGTKLVVKKTESAIQSKKPSKGPRQTTLPENAFSISKAKKEPSKTSVAGSTEKENAPPRSGNKCDATKATPSVEKKEKSLAEQQKDLHLEFEASEASLKEILNHKELTHLELKETSNSELSTKKFSDISDLTLEKMRKLSISKSSALFQGPRRASCRVSNELPSLYKKQKFQNNLPNRRYTEAPGLRTPKLDPYIKIALASVKQMSGTKLNSPALRLKESTCFSPHFKAPVQPPDPYKTAMDSIMRLKARQSVSPAVLKLKANVNNSSPSSKPLDVFEEAKRRIDAWKKAKKTQKQKTLQKFETIEQTTELSKSNICPVVTVSSPPKVTPYAKPLQIDEPKSLYRPLKNLMKTSAFQEHKQRLTDISEHTEIDSTNSLTGNSIDILRQCTDFSMDRRKSSLGCRELPPSVTKSLQNSALDSRFSLYSIGQSTVQDVRSAIISCSPSPRIHTPRPLSFRSPLLGHSPLFNITNTKATFSHPAPICTPLVLKSMAKADEELLSPVKTKLDFEAEAVPKTLETPMVESRSSIYVKNIITKAKIEEANADIECCVIMSVTPSPSICSRILCNPVARVLSNGDNMHFVPIIAEVSGN